MIFKIPKSKHKYLFEQSMFETIWIVFTLLTLFFFVLGVKHLIVGDPNFFTILGTFMMSFTALLFLKKRGEYKIPVLFGVIAGTFFSQYSIFFVNDSSGISDLLWIILIALFAFYGLGSKWGVLIFLINMTGIVFRDIINIDGFNSLNRISELNTILNVTIASFLISYLLHRIIQSSVTANKDFQKANIQLQEQNQKVQIQSDEKTVLLQEIHHRVKNNLQIISSLIRLQSYETDDEKVKVLFETSVHRIQAMALIHEKMYQGDDLSKINLEEYLKSLASDIIQSYQTINVINFEIESELEIIGNRTIVPLALIFNELITNSLKYAFAGDSKGEISLCIKLGKADYFTLDYKDNGLWIENVKESSFGLELIQTFTDQLDGSVERLSDSSGTKYSFNLKNID